MAGDIAAAIAAVRLLINDPNGAVFDNGEIQSLLSLEGGSVKLAAAQAIDTIADNEALVSKVIKDGDLATDGAKVAEALRKRAATLRAQAAKAVADEDAGTDGGFFGLATMPDPCSSTAAELTERRRLGGSGYY